MKTTIDKSEIEEFAIELTDKCPTHQEWIKVIRYGMGFLLTTPDLLIELVFKEADRVVKQRPSQFTEITAVVTILQELGLHFECTKEGTE